MTIRSFHNFFPPEVTAFTTDRSWDFSLSSDSSQLSSEQKQILSTWTNCPDLKIAHARQVHGKDVLVVTGINSEEESALQEADGWVTSQPNAAVVVRTADCMPIFMCDPVRKAVGLLHAGWRGSCQGIVEEGTVSMQKEYSSRPKDLRVAFGPSIRSCCYEVGAEFKEYFPDDVVQRGKGLYLDLAEYNKRRFLRLGVPEENILDSQLCTCCRHDFFSFRREGKKAGRMLSLMMWKGE